jgi:hydrogenase maturation protease
LPASGPSRGAVIGVPVAPILILACGNPARGDDALGPLLVERLGAETRGDADLLWADQLQAEHCLDLKGRRLAVFVDAALDGPEPFRFDEVAADPAAPFETHALTPVGLLRIYREALGEEPPRCRVLAIRGYRFGLVDGLSLGASANLDSAVDFLGAWLRKQEVEGRPLGSQTDEQHPHSRFGC